MQAEIIKGDLLDQDVDAIVNAWNGFWRASEYSIRQSVRNAVALAEQQNFNSITLPIIGSGAGNFNQSKALQFMLDGLRQIDTTVHIHIVQYDG